MTMNGATLAAELLRYRDKEQRRRKRWATFLTWLAVTAVATFLGGWQLMLAVGILHGEWWPSVPTMGYWTACLVVFLVRGVFSSAKTSSREG